MVSKLCSSPIFAAGISAESVGLYEEGFATEMLKYARRMERANAPPEQKAAEVSS
jgi:hypothetical protein